MSIIQGNAHTSAGGGYQIERSLRFNSADSAYLNRTPASASNRKTFTWSGWVKRGALSSSASYFLFAAGSFAGSTNTSFRILNDSINIYWGGTGGPQWTATAVLRDPSAWYHLVFAFDTTQATFGNRLKLYVNGVQSTVWSLQESTGLTAQNSDLYINNNQQHNLGASGTPGNYFDGYMTEVNFIDGQALTPSSFGETDSATGVWKPKAFSGTYGTNGFYLKFADNSGTTSTTLGKDSSGNGNNWTPNNFSVTAGVGNDSLVDTPTNYGTDTGVGGEVRGNYCTLNPLDVNSGSAVYVSDGNLRSAAGAATHQTMATVYVNTGNFYAEATISAVGSVTRVGVGQQNAKVAAGTGNYALYLQSGNKEINGTSTAYGATFTTNDVIGLAYNATSGTLECFKNNVSQGTITLSPQGSYTFFHYGDSTSSVYFNFGQRPFAYTAPSGFKALCTQNLPTPTIGATSTTQANDYFNVGLWTSNSSASNIAVTGIGFQPDFFWGKLRSAATSHRLIDSIRGVTKTLYSNATNAEGTESDAFASFNADGFTIGQDTTGGGLNYLTNTGVGWVWKGGGTGVTNTAGTITSTVSANTTSGFSIVTYSGAGTTSSTIGHGLGVAPSMFIIKCRNNFTGATIWPVYHASVGNTAYLDLSSTSAASTLTAGWNNTSPTSTVFTVGSAAGVNGSGNTFVAYCFANVEGYSRAFSYTGNGSSDGPFVFLGFRPKLVWIKRTDTTGWWYPFDTSRNTYNVANSIIELNGALAETTGSNYAIDINSNGFKLRSTHIDVNASGGTYIGFAWAEAPFKYSLGR